MQWLPRQHYKRLQDGLLGVYSFQHSARKQIVQKGGAAGNSHPNPAAPEEVTGALEVD